MENKKIILIVDDEELNRDILSAILEDEYEIWEAENGIEAIRIMKENAMDISAVLLDLVMPQMDGFGVLTKMREMDLIDHVPVLIISGENSLNIEKKCFEYGISDFIHKPFDNSLVRKRTRNITELFSYKNRLEEKVERQGLALRDQNRVLRKQAEKLKKTNTQIIEVLGTMVESRNLESGEHVMRVKGYTQILALIMKERYPEYELTAENIEMIGDASVLHDIGKIAIPDNILLKPGRLTDEEFEVMKSHTSKGSEIIKKIQNMWSPKYAKLSYEISRYHHERYNGKGYPDHLKGDEIPISAQLVSVADVYDALVNERCYKSAFTTDQAFSMITGGECGEFSPKLLDCFAIGREEFERLAASK